jgi:restriction system protein
MERTVTQSTGRPIATRKKGKSGPEFVQLFAPVLDTLRELGDSGRPKEVGERVAEKMSITEEELNRTNKSGQSRFANQVAWARFYLAKAGLIDTSHRGVWTLTESGRHTHLDHEQALAVFRRVQGLFKDSEIEGEALPDAADESAAPDEQTPGVEGFREEMTKTLHSLSPKGFERLCQRILREVGFEEVIVTGRSNDGGIDGYGTLRINRLVSDRVLFQCKRHAKQISPSYIREFRGSMAARVDRGIFLATSTFSAEAKREAAREGAAPVEMVDLDALISLLADLGLGVTAKTVFVVDRQFFHEYMPTSSDQISN